MSIVLLQSSDRPDAPVLRLFIRLCLLNTGRVFVTYEADNDKHVNEIINFVALLRHNGFDTHVCRVSIVATQQLRCVVLSDQKSSTTGKLLKMGEPVRDVILDILKTEEEHKSL